MDDPTGYLYRTAMNLFRTKYRRAIMALRKITLLLSRTTNPFDEIEINDDLLGVALLRLRHDSAPPSY